MTVAKMMTGEQVCKLDPPQAKLFGQPESTWAICELKGLYIETDALQTVWETDLVEWLPVFSFEPARRDMMVYPKPPAGRYWSRDDVKLSVRQGPEGTEEVLMQTSVSTRKSFAAGQRA